MEFINPKGRDDLERSGGSQDPAAGSDGSNTVPDDDWVWLTSYSRIPVSGPYIYQGLVLPYSNSRHAF